MGRPHKERRVEQIPPVTHYKPAGVPLHDLEEITITIEEMEAIRLADIEQLDQNAAAERMEVSRPTFHRIVNTAHQKIASALWQGHSLMIGGGNFRVSNHRLDLRHFTCQTCDHHWSLPHGTGQRGHDLTCPVCQAATVRRTKD